jgi:DNA-binding PadR family transcriptional regulator
MTALLDRLEKRGLARRTRDMKDRRRVLVEVTPALRQMAAQLYGTPDEGADALAAYTNEQLEFLVGFLRGNAAYPGRADAAARRPQGPTSEREASDGPRSGSRRRHRRRGTLNA